MTAALERVGNFAVMDFQRQPFGDGGFAHAGVANVDRIVLAPPAQHVNGSFDLVVAADQRIDLAPARFLDQIDGKRFQRIDPSRRTVAVFIVISSSSSAGDAGSSSPPIFDTPWET